MKNWLIDLYDWLFYQSGFSWREWREIAEGARKDDFQFPDDWDGWW